MWITATVSTSSGPCFCPTGCADCVYRSPTSYANDTANFLALDNESSVPDVRLGASTVVLDGSEALEECPSDALLECMSCDTAAGYFPAVFSGFHTSKVTVNSAAVPLQGTGVMCLYQNECDTLSAVCGVNFTFTEFGITCGYLTGFFVLLLAIFVSIRQIPYMLNTCDPNLYMEPENPRYPPFRIPPKHYPGPFGWLKRAWHLTDTDILNHATPDELMLLRWFRMLYHWFFGGALFCTPVLMALYYADSQDLNLDDSTRAALGMKRMTIATAHSRYVFWMVVAEMWALSIWLVYLLTRETKGYVRLIWKLGPSKLGIKSHAVVVNDIPMLTTDPLPLDMLKRKNTGMFNAINTAILNKQKDGASSPTTSPGASPSASPRALPPITGRYSLAEDEREQEGQDAALAWLKRNHSEVRGFMNSVPLEELESLRACTKTELAEAVKQKLEGVLGEGCVVSCLSTRDTRALDKVSMVWKAANVRHLQALIMEARLKDELAQAEAETVRAKGGLGRLPTFKEYEFDLEMDDKSSIGGSFGAFESTSEDGGEDGVGSGEKLKEADPKVQKLRAKCEWATAERETARSKLNDALAAFDKARSDFIQDESPTPCFVVVFSRQMDAVIAGQVQIDSTFGSWRTDPAPGPNDLVWHNTALTTKQRWRKSAWAKLYATLMVVFFMVPVNLLVAAVSAGRSEIVEGLGEGFFKVIVGLILTIFLVVGHILSYKISRQYGMIARSKMDVTGASIYFWLLVFNLYIGNLSERLVWDDVLDWIQNPSLVLHTLILRCVETSSFFLQFCMLRIAQSCPLELIHPPFHLGFVVKTLVHMARAGEKPTPKMIQNWTEPENTPLHRVPAQTMMVAFLGIMYCVTAPFFLPVVGLFFSIYYLFFKHNLCYHYMQPYASGQTLWAWLVKNTFICLIISQVILLLGLPTLVEDGGSTDYLRLALLPLPFLSSLQMIRTKAILRQSAKLPVHQPSGSESSKEGALPDENGIFDEKGVVGESLSFMKRTALNLRSPGSESSSSRSITFDSPKRQKSETNSARKTTKRLNLTNEEARNEVERLVKSGKWRNYQPISIWPQVNEKAAASLIIRRWRENKQVKLRIARRRADEAFGLTAHPSRESPGKFAAHPSRESPGKPPLSPARSGGRDLLHQ